MQVRKALSVSVLLGLASLFAPVTLMAPVAAAEVAEPAAPGTPSPALADFDLFSGNDPRLASRIDAILSRPSYRNALWGLDIFCLDERRVVYTLNSDKHFSPASNVKVFTTAAALDRLGPDFRFRTRVAYEGMLSLDGLLAGDLVLFGEGDPLLAAHPFEEDDPYFNLDLLARKVYEAGIREVAGDVVGDDSYFEYAPHGEGWTSSDLVRFYGAPVSALSFNDNLIAVSARPGPAGGRPGRVFARPVSSAFTVSNRSTTAARGAKSTAQIHRFRSGNGAQVTGQIPLGSRGVLRHFPVGDPAQFTAGVFHQRLIRAGVKVRGKARARHAHDFRLPYAAQDVFVHYSPPLVEIIGQINKRSQNLYAEILLRTMGAEIRSEGSDRSGLEVVREFLAGVGITPDTADLYDGSGLSRKNLITPRTETLLLASLAQKPYFEMFKESLAVSGLDGTLKNRMLGTSATGRIYGKTGSLNQVATLGGYVLTESGSTLAFSILLNQYNFAPAAALRALDEICAVLASTHDSRSSSSR